MRPRVSTNLQITHGAGIQVATEIRVVPATQVHITRVVSLSSFVSNTLRSTRRLLWTRVLPLAPVPPALHPTLQLKILLFLVQFLALLLVF